MSRDEHSTPRRHDADAPPRAPMAEGEIVEAERVAEEIVAPSAPTAGAAPRSTQAAPPPFVPRGAFPRPSGGAAPPWYDTLPGMLFLLFAALGPLALPLLWRSRRFSLPTKAILTLIVVAATIVVVVLLIWVVDQFARQMRELRDLLQPAGGI